MTPKGKKYKKEYAMQLFKIAIGDLGSAFDLRKGSRGRPENICFLTQQAIEKCLKSVLCKLGENILHTHDLGTLVSALPPDYQPPHAETFSLLTDYATVRRYEEGFEVISPEDLDAVLELGTQTIEWAGQILKETE